MLIILGFCLLLVACSGSVNESPDTKYKVSAQLLFSANSFGFMDSIGATLSKQQEEMSKAILLSTETIMKTLDRNHIGVDQIDKYRSRLALTKLPHSSIYDLDFYCNNADSGLQLLDTMLTVYFELMQTIQNKSINRKIKAIENQLDSMKLNLQQLDRSFQDLSQENNAILSISTGSQNMCLKLCIKLEEEIRQLKLKLVELERLKSFVNKGDRITELHFMLDDQYLLPAREQYNQLHASEKSTEFMSISEDILIYVKNMQQALKADVTALQADLGRTLTDLDRIEKEPKTSNEMKRVMLTNEKLYTFLMQKLAEYKIEKAGFIPETKVISAPRAILLDK